MKKVLFFLFTAAMLSSAIPFHASAGNYKVDDAAVDRLFDFATDVSADLFNLQASEISGLLLNPGLAKYPVMDEDKEMVAGLVALGSWLFGVGWLVPIHRFILGTGGQPVKIFLLYCITLSGCGIILLIDGIVLLLDDSGTKYIDNPKFIMWMGGGGGSGRAKPAN
jgi:TM2 domain-containing membrane protein YozV